MKTIGTLFAVAAFAIVGSEIRPWRVVEMIGAGLFWQVVLAWVDWTAAGLKKHSLWISSASKLREMSCRAAHVGEDCR